MDIHKNFTGKNGPLLIAEIGGNHEGNFKKAVELTHLAIESGADIIKFQLYSAEGLVNKRLSNDRFKHFEKFELTKEQHITLAKLVQEAGLKYMASVWDLNMLEWIDPYCEIYKIGSGDLTAYPILKEFAQRRKPIILSTGLSSEDEVVDSVEFVQNIDAFYTKANNFALLQCTSMYPIQFADANLAVMQRLKSITGLTIGYSDHTIGTVALKVAYALGAQILEFHFTDNTENSQFRDHKVSLTKDNVQELIAYIQNVNVLVGSSSKQPTAIEIDNGHVVSFRRGIFLRHNMKRGERVKMDDLIFLRPCEGLGSQYYKLILGKCLLQDVTAFSPLSLTLFEEKENE